MEKLKLIVSTILVLFLAANLLSRQPMDIIQSSNQAVIDILSKKTRISGETESKLLKIIDRITSFNQIAKNVTTRFCMKLSKSQCAQFNRIFIELLRISSLKKMGRYRADRFKYLEQKIVGNKAVVRTIAYYESEEVQLDYHLQKPDKGAWQIVNYIIDDIDTIRNYRKQFRRLFAKYSFDKVMERLNRKIKQYQQENQKG